MPRERIIALDGVRGLAILGVFAFHCALFSSNNVTNLVGRYVLKICSYGWVGVDLFFVLSGYLITSILLATKDNQNYFANFYARRTLRIFPLYFLVLSAVAVAFWARSDLRSSMPEVYSTQTWYWLYLQNWLPPIYGDRIVETSPLGHFWSLAIEEQFYLAWPLIVWALSRRTLLVISCGLIALSLLARIAVVAVDGTPNAHAIIYFSTVTRLDTLSAGAILALESRRLSNYAAPLLLSSGVALLLIAIFHRNELALNNWPMTTIGLSITAAASAGLILIGINGSQVLCIVPLRMLGKYSYALYVFHLPIMKVMHAVLASYVSGVAFVPIFIATSVGATIVAAVASWHLLEKRCLAFKNAISSREQIAPATVS